MVDFNLPTLNDYLDSRIVETEQTKKIDLGRLKKECGDEYIFYEEPVFDVEKVEKKLFDFTKTQFLD